MSLEDEIQQREFYNEWHRLRVNLLYTSGWLSRQLKELFEPFDLTQAQYNILRILQGAYPNPLSTLNLRQRMIDKMSDTSRMVDRLQAKGWVIKKPCKHDRRLVEVTITQEGIALLTEVSKHFDAFDDVVQGLKKDEAVQLNQLLDKLRHDTSD